MRRTHPAACSWSLRWGASLNQRMKANGVGAGCLPGNMQTHILHWAAGWLGAALGGKVLQWLARYCSAACHKHVVSIPFYFVLVISHYLPLFHPSSARKENNFLCLKWGGKKRHWKDVLAGHAPAVLTSAVNRSRTSAYACSSRPCTPNRWTCTQSNHGRLKKLPFALICWIIGACSSGIHGNRPARQAPSTFLMMRVGPSCTDARVSAAMCKVEKISC